MSEIKKCRLSANRLLHRFGFVDGTRCVAVCALSIMVVFGAIRSLAADDAYILSDGGTMLNTGYFVNDKTKLEIDFELASTDKSRYIMGTTASGNSGTVCALWVNGYKNLEPRITGWGGSIEDKIPTERRKVVFDLSDNCTVKLFEHGSDVAKKTKTKSNTSNFSVNGVSQFPLALFAASTNATGVEYANACNVKIYSLRIWEYHDGEYDIVHEFLPCVKGDVPGFKDVVTGGFRTAEDVSSLSAGGDVERIRDDGFVETVNNEANGTTAGYTGGHYIDTKYYPGPSTRIELDYAIANNKSNSHFCRIMKCMAEDGTVGDTNQFAVSYNDAGLLFSLGPDYIDQDCGLPSTVATRSQYVRRTAILDAKNSMVSLVTSAYTNFTSAVSAAPCPMGVTLKIAANGGGTGGFAPIRIYGLKIYESEVLVHHYRPYVMNGAYGLVSGNSFLGFSWTATRQSYNGTPTAGGDVEVSSVRDYDAFALFSGMQSIDTGYKANGKSKFVVDFAFANANNKQNENYNQQVVFDTGDEAHDDIMGRVYINGKNGNNGKYAWNYSTNGVYADTSVIADHQRRLFTIDALNDQVRMTPGSAADNTYNGDYKIKPAENFHDKECSGTTKIGSNFMMDKNFARIRLYRFTIWDDGTKVRDFVPASTDGVACLYDLVEGKVYASETSTPLSIGGCGYDGTESWIDVPQGGSLERASSEKILLAKAVGAVSYKWECNGEPISGGEDGELKVLWRRPSGMYTYTVTPVYDVFGFPAEGNPVSVQIEMKPSGMMLSIR